MTTRSKKKILVFTGAGVSAESGIKTFRDHAGLWNNYRIEEVATPEAWIINPELVLAFYNLRRRELKNVVPNRAHMLIASLEKYFDVSVVTQNVDDLHERAGSTKVIHLHGELMKARSTIHPQDIVCWETDLHLGDCCRAGGQLRPHIVWFGEMLDELKVREAEHCAAEADVCVIVGTSMQVYPACNIPYETRQDCQVFFVDPHADSMTIRIPGERLVRLPVIASEGMEEVCKRLLGA